MNSEEKSPGTAGTVFTRANTLIEHKDTKFRDNPIRQKLYELFLSGGEYSVVELSSTLKIPDPRSHIRYIRDAGVPISDYWVKSELSRYKIYFMAESGNVQKN